MGSIYEAALRALEKKTKPLGSLGRLESLAVELAVAQDALEPDLSRVWGLIFAADHGVSRDGVSAYPREVTPQMVLNIAGGGSAVATLARQWGVRVEVFDVGVDAPFVEAPHVHNWRVGRGSANIRTASAMSESELEASLSAGRRALAMANESGARCVVIGEMGIGNTTPASAMLSSLLGISAEASTGAGTGVAGEALAFKIDVVREAVARVGPTEDARVILRELGGFEIAAMVGVCLGAVASKSVVVVDGFITTLSALVACRVDPRVRQQLVFAHRSAEAGHQHALDALNARPVLDLGMRLGEGSGAMLSVPILRGAAAILKEMATFADAGVSEREDA